MRTNTRSDRKRNIVIPAGGLLLLGVFAFTVLNIQNLIDLAPTAQAQKDVDQSRNPTPFNCSNATLEGKYAVKGDGFVPGGPPPAPMVPFATVSQMTLDGAGSLSNDVTVSRNGQIFRNIDPGTYALNPDCTGTMTISITEPPFQLNFDVVVADLQGPEGREFYFIATTPSVVTHTAKRIR
jgi:hypothetical protein